VATGPLPFSFCAASPHSNAEIDVRATLAEKLGVEGEPYVMLGACNPELTRRALYIERDRPADRSPPPGSDSPASDRNAL
jgi:hypothetical protein